MSLDLHRSTNEDVAKLLKEMSLYHMMNGVAFKPQAYERASWSIQSLDRPLWQIYEDAEEAEEGKGWKAIKAVDSVGKGIAQRIEELFKTGTIVDLEEMRKECPVDIFGLMAIEGVGAKKVKALYEGLGVKNVDELAEAARQQRVRELKGFGEKSEQKILRHVELLSQTQGRWPIGDIRDVAFGIEAELKQLPEVQDAVVCGSMRRFRETIGDIDILCISTDHAKVMEYFVGMPAVEAVYAQGETKSMVRLAIGIDADLRVLDAESFGAALLYFTGSKHHNIMLRNIAIKKGLKLNEYGVFREETSIAGKTEADCYAALDLPYMPPEIREDHGEIEAAREGRLPDLIEAGDLRGDLQVTSNWSDGASSITDLAEAARALGYEYIAITDHTSDLVSIGLDEEKLLEQKADIDQLNATSNGFRILSGAEVNIREDGSLDISDEVLAQLDLVGVAVHHHFDLSRSAQTARLVKAVSHPHVNILFHATGRILGEREAIDVDMEEVIDAAVQHNTIVEVDGHPSRLDLKDDHVRLAVDSGAKIAISSDAHSIETLRYARDFGVPVARRGWAEKKDVVNALPLKELLDLL